MTGRIVTLTLNPAIDLACEAKSVRPVHKIRTYGERQDPGGGGLNVSRVVHELGGDTLAVVLAGGATGRLLDHLIDEAGVPRRTVRIGGATRISQTILDHESGLEYRFVPEGPEISEAEWRGVLDALDTVEGEWLVVSGSLPRGVPAHFYALVAEKAATRGFRLALDTSGPALKAALGHGLALIKPSLSELEALADRELASPQAQEEVLAELVARGAADIVALTLGGDGAVLATRGGVLRLAAPPVEVKGTVGAGDSFLAAMVLALSRGAAVEDAFAWGVAAGTAAVSSSGTAHPTLETIRRLHDAVRAVRA